MKCMHSIKHCNILTVTGLFDWVIQSTPHPHHQDKADKLSVEQDIKAYFLLVKCLGEKVDTVFASACQYVAEAVA